MLPGEFSPYRSPCFIECLAVTPSKISESRLNRSTLPDDRRETHEDSTYSYQSKSPLKFQEREQPKVVAQIRNKYQQGTEILDDNERMNRMILEKCRSIVEGSKQKTDKKPNSQV